MAGQYGGRPLPFPHSWSERACGPVPSRPHVLTLANISGEPLTFPYVQGGGGACVKACLSAPCVSVCVCVLWPLVRTCFVFHLGEVTWKNLLRRAPATRSEADGSTWSHKNRKPSFITRRPEVNPDQPTGDRVRCTRGCGIQIPACHTVIWTPS